MCFFSSTPSPSHLPVPPKPYISRNAVTIAWTLGHSICAFLIRSDSPGELESKYLHTHLNNIDEKFKQRYKHIWFYKLSMIVYIIKKI